QDATPRTVYLDFLPTRFLFVPAQSGVQVDTTWVSVPLTGRRATTSDVAAQAEGLAPELALAEIAWGARAASLVGQRVVNHVPMGEYRVSVDLTRALAKARNAHRGAIAAAIESQLAALRASGDRPRYLPITVL